MAKSTTETDTLTTHPKLLFDVISKQAGSLSKAILEGVMNSVDAKSKLCLIKVTADKVVIQDDGQGFRSREEIKQWFNVFGQPHDESEGKIYASFRMGRGQMFAFGVNQWRSGRFSMHGIDIKHRGLDYDVTEHPGEKVPGCEITIQLYEKLGETEIMSIEQDMKRWVRYCPIDVRLNGKGLTVDPTQEKWDQNDEDAYIRLDSSENVKVYNLGVLVNAPDSYRFGTGGVVVSKKRLEVNFARNDVMASCPVWKKVAKYLNANGTNKGLRKDRLSNFSRRHLITQVLGGQLSPQELFGKAIIPSVTGRSFTPSQLLFHAHGVVTVAKKGDRVGDNIQRHRSAFVLAEECLEWFNVTTPQELVNKLNELFAGKWQQQLEYEPYVALAEKVNGDYRALLEHDLPWQQKIWLRAIRQADATIRCKDMTAANWHDRWENQRDYKVGIGPADGWTDGSETITINQAFLEKMKFDLESCGEVGALLLHEYCHYGNSAGDHDHDQEFYEEYHDRSRRLGGFNAACLTALNRVLKREGRKRNRRLTLTVDTVNKLEEKSNAVLAARQG